MNTSDMEVGDIHSTYKYGYLEVMKYVDSNTVHVRFTRTHYECIVTELSIRTGAVIDEIVYGTPKDMMPGTIYTSNQDGDFEVVAYYTTKEVYIKFIDTGSERTVQAPAIRKGTCKDPLKDRTPEGMRTGIRYDHSKLGKFTIVKYHGRRDVVVKFDGQRQLGTISANTVKSGKREISFT